MPSVDRSGLDISICVPTRNRSAQLNRCLSHLLTFSSFRFEIVIGDNASVDDTNDVVSDFAAKFPHLKYIRHDSNIGHARNAQSILMQARARYAYVLSDDDIVFENGLGLLRAALDADGNVAAAIGTYTSSVALPADDISYAGARYSRIGRGNYLELANNIWEFDHYPMLRTEIFRRYCAYYERGFGVGAMFTQLLAHGDILLVDRPIYHHFESAVSLTTSFPESWFLDFCNADIEIAFTNVPKPLSVDQINTLRSNFLRTIYLQCVRFCRMQRDYLLMWHFLIRAKALGGVTALCLGRCEQEFLLRVLLRRICQLIGDMGAKKIWLENTPLLLALRAQMQELLPANEFSVLENAAAAESSNIVLLERSASDISMWSAPTIALYDVLATMRLTAYPLELTADGNKIKIAVLSPPGEAPDFALLMADYALPANVLAQAAAAEVTEVLQKPSVSEDSKIRRNQLCPCGSGKKYKHCHGRYV